MVHCIPEMVFRKIDLENKSAETKRHAILINQSVKELITALTINSYLSINHNVLIRYDSLEMYAIGVIFHLVCVNTHVRNKKCTH